MEWNLWKFYLGLTQHEYYIISFFGIWYPPDFPCVEISETLTVVLAV